MALSGSLLLFLGFISIAEIAFSICVPPVHCIDNMDDFDARDKFQYVVGLYKQLNIKIEGRPLGLHGKRINFDQKLVYHLVFHYADNKVNDVIQTCTFVVSTAPEKCESIGTYCTGFLKRPPRPLLNLRPIINCKNDLHFAEADTVVETELLTESAAEPATKTKAETEALPKEDPRAETSAEGNSPKNPNATTIPSSPFRMFN